jgi:hypothetical protein
VRLVCRSESSARSSARRKCRVVAGGGGGLVPFTNSRYDPVTGQFLPPGYAPPLVTLDGYLPAPGELAEPPYAPDATYAALEPPE